MEPGLRGREDTGGPGHRGGVADLPLWSPAFGAGKTSTAPAAGRGGLVPLWSPAFGAGKTSPIRGPPSVRVWPLWSPAFGAGKTRSGSRRGLGRPCRYGARPSGPGRRDCTICRRFRPGAPLWSPAFGAGKTAAGHPHRRHRRRAAMEPGLRGREDRPGGEHRAGPPVSRYGARPSGPGRPSVDTIWPGMPRTPLWSPAFGAGKTPSNGRSPVDWVLPLWSPAFGAGKTRVGRRCSRGRAAGRYGARPSGPGRPGGGAGGSSGRIARRYGARPSGPGRPRLHLLGRRPVQPAAMEPGLRGREDGCPACRPGRRRAGRYGARPSGPGRPPGSRGPTARRRRAAMEPGLRGREDRTVRGALPGAGQAAMEPGLRGREDQQVASMYEVMLVEPLWSPAFGAGKTRRA